MAKIDTVIALISAGLREDSAAFIKIVKRLISEEKRKKHFQIAERLERLLFNKPGKK